MGQVNETDLQQPMKKEYMQLEMDDALRPAALGKACPLTRTEDATSWMSLAWCHPHLHEQAAAGCKKVGVTIALDGSEDDLVCKEARAGMNCR